MYFISFFNIIGLLCILFWLYNHFSGRKFRKEMEEEGNWYLDIAWFSGPIGLAFLVIDLPMQLFLPYKWMLSIEIAIPLLLIIFAVIVYLSGRKN